MLGVGIAICIGLWACQDTAAVPALGFTLGPGRWAVVVVAMLAAAIPAVRRLLNKLGGLLTPRTPRGRFRTALAVAGVSAGYFILTAHLQDRDLFPKTHDEQSYLLQMHMLAAGRLWMPQHPLADFFDTFYVLARPVYASLYFPGASLLYLPTVLLHLPTSLMPALVAGAIVGLVYRVIAELIDAPAALLAALLVVSLEWFRVYSVLLTGHEPMLLLGLLLVWARPRARAGWAVAMGVSAGWGAITRPADALCFAIPVGLGILFDLFKPAVADIARGMTRPGRSFAKTLLCVIGGATPFLSLQAYFDKGVTGSVFETPYGLYLRQDQPNTSFGFHPYDPRARPQSVVQQKQDLYANFFARYVRRHQPGEFLSWWGRVYLPMTADTTLPGQPLVALLPAGLLAVWARRRLVLALVPLLFLTIYACNTFFLEHYALLIAPSVAMLAVLGIRRLAATMAPIGPCLTAGVIVLCITTLPEFNPLWGASHQINDETFPAPLMRAVRTEMPFAADLHRPAVVLFRYTNGQNIQEEPVYNAEVAWPDDASIICAHDLGPRNREIFEYYAQRQPDRYFYRWDRTTRQIEDLGYARDLARK
jgi:hypothetical protein